jgi:serine protease inhibitor
MAKKLFLIGLLLVAIFLLQCGDDVVNPPSPGPPNLTAAEKEMIKSSNKFSFDIFKEIASEEGDTNIFISPLSMSYALGMTYNGANGQTEQAMREVLGYGDLTDQEINVSYKNLTEALISLDPEVVFEIANSIWYRLGFSVLDEFITVNRDYFDAEVSGLDFNDPGACDIINNWISQKTHEKIKEVLKPPIDPTTVMFLVNAIYFNGTWTYEFDPDSTTEAYFFPDGISHITVDMMRQSNVFPRYFNDEFQAVSLPYGDAGYCMTIFLPRLDQSLDDLIAQFNQDNWDDWLARFSEDTVIFSMPKFKFGYGLKLNDALTALGMGIAFDDGLADFTGINPLGNLFISRVIHKAFVQVDEKGTEAAAVTVVEVGFTSVGPEQHMTVDRPFVFVIHEENTGAILFMGKVVNPVWEEG